MLCFPSLYTKRHFENLALTFCASHVEPEMFPVTSLSHNHLTSIIGLLLFIYFLWQTIRAEVTQSRRVCWLGVVCSAWSKLLGLRTAAWRSEKHDSYCGEIQYMCIHMWDSQTSRSILCSTLLFFYLLSWLTV